MNVRRVAFVGHFSPASSALDKANSTAANQVQNQILQELIGVCAADSVYCYVMAPHASWPEGPFLTRSRQEGAVEFVGYINLPVLKHVIFSLRFFWRMCIARPNLCLQYNSYLFENIALLTFRLIFRSSILAVIIQDIHAISGNRFFSKKYFRSLFEKASLSLARRFSIIVPVSDAIISEFGFDPSKCFVFKGGVTKFADELALYECGDLEDIGVFAGGLEPHNGIDKLIEQWLLNECKQELHVFGKGSLEEYVRLSALRSEKIIFHGFQPERVIINFQRKARWNFCLRYSSGIDERYFFPSKFFNILSAPGCVVVNEFFGLPEDLIKYLIVVRDDISDIVPRLASVPFKLISDITRDRRVIVRANHSWRACIKKILDFYKSVGN